MGKKLTFQVLPLVGAMVPRDDAAKAFLDKHSDKIVEVDAPKVQRSPQHNRLFWAVANKTYGTLPDEYADQWMSPHDMVKGLQLAFGICDQIQKPVKGGWEIVQVPKSLDFGNMDQDEFNAVSEKLFRGMAHCLGVSVNELLEE